MKLAGNAKLSVASASSRYARFAALTLHVWGNCLIDSCLPPPPASGSLALSQYRPLWAHSHQVPSKCQCPANVACARDLPPRLVCHREVTHKPADKLIGQSVTRLPKQVKYIAGWLVIGQQVMGNTNPKSLVNELARVLPSCLMEHRLRRTVHCVII